MSAPLLSLLPNPNMHDKHINMTVSKCQSPCDGHLLRCSSYPSSLSTSAGESESGGSSSSNNNYNHNDDSLIGKASQTVFALHRQLTVERDRNRQLLAELVAAKQTGLELVLHRVELEKTENRQLRDEVHRQRKLISNLQQQLAAIAVSGNDNNDNRVAVFDCASSLPGVDSPVVTSCSQTRNCCFQQQKTALLVPDFDVGSAACAPLTASCVDVVDQRPAPDTLNVAVACCSCKCCSRSSSCSSVPKSASAQVSTVDTQTFREKNALESGVKEMENIVERWHVYAEQRDQYARVLARRCAEFELIVKKYEQQAKDDRTQLEQQAQLISVVEKENCQLKTKVVDVESRLGQTSRRLYSQQQWTRAAQEQINVLQAQLVVYKEDFISEQRDRQIAEQRISDLERQLVAIVEQSRRYEPVTTTNHTSPERVQQSSPVVPLPNFSNCGSSNCNHADNAFPLLVARGTGVQTSAGMNRGEFVIVSKSKQKVIDSDGSTASI